MFLSYFLVDQSYAISISEFTKNDRTDRALYYFGAGIVMWTVWQISTIVGILIGTSIPKSFSLEFAIPLTFLALLTNFLSKKHFVVTAVISAVLMVLLKSLPLNLGFFIAVFTGVFTGQFYKRISYDKI